MRTPDLANAILSLRPGAEYHLLDSNDLATLAWSDERLRPTDAEIGAELARLAGASVQLVAYAATKRWQKEVGGIVVNGIPVPTDDRAKLLILGAAQTLADNASAPFVSGGVNYGTLTGVQFRALNAAIVAHVQASFVALADVLSGIKAGSVTTTGQVDAAKWPANT